MFSIDALHICYKKKTTSKIARVVGTRWRSHCLLKYKYITNIQVSADDNKIIKRVTSCLYIYMSDRFYHTQIISPQYIVVLSKSLLETVIRLTSWTYHWNVYLGISNCMRFDGMSTNFDMTRTSSSYETFPQLGPVSDGVQWEDYGSGLSMRYQLVIP